jgi:hypothetical protein
MERPTGRRGRRRRGLVSDDKLESVMSDLVLSPYCVLSVLAPCSCRQSALVGFELK